MLEKHSLWWIKLEMLPILSTSDVQQGIQLLWELSSELKVQPRKCQNPDPAYSFHYITPLCFTFVGSKSHFSHVCMLSHFSHVWLCVTPWTVAQQAPLPMGFSRQEYWQGLSCLPSRGSYQPRDQTHVSHVFCIGRPVLYHWHHLGSPYNTWKWKLLLCLTLYSPWNSPGQNTRVGSLSLLQGIFPNQGLNPGLLHCRQILYQLSQKGSSYNTYYIQNMC